MGDGFEKASNKKSCSASDDDDDDVYDDGSAPDVTGAECTDVIPDCAVCFRRRGRTLCRRCEAGFEKARNKKSCSASDDDDDDVDDYEDSYDDGSAPDVTGAECTDIIPDCAV